MAIKKTKHNWKSIEKSLLSDDEKIFDSMIKFLEKNGKVEYLSKIIGLLNKINDARKAKVFSFLCKLKQKDAAPIMMEIVKDENKKADEEEFWIFTHQEFADTYKEYSQEILDSMNS